MATSLAIWLSFSAFAMLYSEKYFIAVISALFSFSCVVANTKADVHSTLMQQAVL